MRYHTSPSGANCSGARRDPAFRPRSRHSAKWRRLDAVGSHHIASRSTSTFRRSNTAVSRDLFVVAIDVNPVGAQYSAAIWTCDDHRSTLVGSDVCPTDTGWRGRCTPRIGIHERNGNQKNPEQELARATKGSRVLFRTDRPGRVAEGAAVVTGTRGMRLTGTVRRRSEAR